MKKERNTMKRRIRASNRYILEDPKKARLQNDWDDVGFDGESDTSLDNGITMILDEAIDLSISGCYVPTHNNNFKTKLINKPVVNNRDPPPTKSDYEADGSDSATSGSDLEMQPFIYEHCLQCKKNNSNATFRYCLDCYRFEKFLNPRGKVRRRSRWHMPAWLRKNRKSQKVMVNRSTDNVRSSNKSKNCKETSSVQFAKRERDYAEQDSVDNLLCIGCEKCPRDGVFVHGHTIHRKFCFDCATEALKCHNNHCSVCKKRVTKLLRDASFFN